MKTLQRRFAFIRRYVLGVLLVVPLVFAQGAQPQAAMVQTDASGRATGVLGLPVDSQTYNISFVQGFHPDIFGTTDGVFLNASSFVNAINEALNDAESPLISPINSDNTLTLFLVPGPGNGGVADVEATAGRCVLDLMLLICEETGWTLFPSTTIVGDASIANWAVPSPVPLPAALPLFGSALAMLGVVGWRRRQAGA